MSPAAKLTLAELRCAKTTAIRRLTSALRLRRGSVTAAAADLGLAPQTLWKLGREVDAVGAALSAHAMGRSGAGNVAWRARVAQLRRPAESTRTTKNHHGLG